MRIVTEQQLLEIDKRRLGTKYKDEEAATYVNGNDLKKVSLNLRSFAILTMVQERMGTGHIDIWSYRSRSV